MPAHEVAPTRIAEIASFCGAVLGLALGSAASAQVVESSTLASSYSYSVGSQQGSNANSPDNVRLFISDTSNGFQSDLGLALTSSLDNGSFFFLQNGYCVGDCAVTITTDITFTLTNMGTSPVDLRFDSLITPGHLARSNFFGGSASQRGNFLFTVTQDSTPLYTANGVNSARPPFPIVETSDGVPFNNLVANSNTPAWDVLDWSATNLSIDLLTIGAGQSTTFTYHSQLDISTSNPSCLDTTQCLGYQVAFGDPRDRGAPTIQTAGRFAALQAFDGELALLAAPASPAVGAAYDPFLVTYAFVPQNSALPGMPPAIPPLSYDIPYRPLEPIPEPATWAMMLLGFAAVGAMARRRRGNTAIPGPA